MGALALIGLDIPAQVNMDFTLHEIHVLSYFYHWGREECWNMPCTERGVFVDLIRKQLRMENSSS